MTARPVRKPVQQQGSRGPRCFCNAFRDDHKESAKCSLYQPRPCVCGHPHGSHAARCQEKHCGCKAYKEDTSPAFLLRRGVRAGQWQFMPTGDLEKMTEPRFEFKTRVLSVLLMATLGQDDRERGRNRFARITDAKTGKVRFLRPQDIVVKLRSKEKLPGTEKGHVRRALEELDTQDGLVRRLGVEQEGATPINGMRRKGRVALALYFKPRKVKPKPAAEPEFGGQPAPDLGVKSGPQKNVTPQKDSQLSTTFLTDLSSRLSATVVKSFREALRTAMDLGVKVGPQNLIDEVVAEVEKGVRNGYQKLVLGASFPAALKEDSISSREPLRPSVFPSQPYIQERRAGGRVQQQAPARPQESDLLKTGLNQRKLFPDEELCEQLRTELGSTPLPHFFLVLDQRLKRGRIGTGLLMKQAQKASQSYTAEQPAPSKQEKQRQEAEEVLRHPQDFDQLSVEWAEKFLEVQTKGATG